MARRTGPPSPPRPRRSRSARTERSSGRRPRRAHRSELRSRVLVAIPALGFAVLVVSQGGAVFAVATAALGLVCMHELYRMYARARPIRLAGMLALIGLALAAYLGDERQVMLVLAASLPLVFLFGLALPGGGRLAPSVALTLLGVVWIGVATAHAVLLVKLPHGNAIVVDVLVATFAGDTGAYLGGRALGTRRLAPRVSPNKTVEGLAIGVLTAVVATWCAGLYQDWLGHGEAVLLGLAVGLVAPLGDLFESQVKRDAGVKDSGSLFGAHGGALDRLDAALFGLVAGYYVWLAML
jgi:phosphatidate cytidylyltransferase